jgi:hypothetical protein
MFNWSARVVPVRARGFLTEQFLEVPRASLTTKRSVREVEDVLPDEI